MELKNAKRLKGEDLSSSAFYKNTLQLPSNVYVLSVKEKCYFAAKLLSECDKK